MSRPLVRQLFERASVLLRPTLERDPETRFVWNENTTDSPVYRRRLVMVLCVGYIHVRNHAVAASGLPEGR